MVLLMAIEWDVCWVHTGETPLEDWTLPSKFASTRCSVQKTTRQMLNPTYLKSALVRSLGRHGAVPRQAGLLFPIRRAMLTPTTHDTWSSMMCNQNDPVDIDHTRAPCEWEMRNAAHVDH